MEGVAISENPSRMEGGDQEGTTLPSDTKIGEFCSSDIQVAINEGNRQRRTFFVVKMGKAGVSMPFQQVIPSGFSRYHPKLSLEDVILERPCSRSWVVTIRSLNNVLRFAKGWRQFSVENHLREGYQLLFHLVGKARFVVHFFDNVGKGHAGISPLKPMPDFVQPFPAPRMDEEDAREPPASETLLAKPPPPFETSLAEPLTVPTTSIDKTPALNADDAKVILRQFFTQVHPNVSTNVPNSKAAVPREDMFCANGVHNDIDGLKTEHANEGSYEEQATAGGKAYILIDSDDDEELVKQDLPVLFVRTPLKRDFSRRMDNTVAGKSYSGDHTGLHSPEKIRTPQLARKPNHLMPEERVDYVDRDNNSWKFLERQRSVRKEPSQAGHGPATFAKSESHGHRRDLYKEETMSRHGYPLGYHYEARDQTSTRGDFLQRASAVEGRPFAGLSPAKILCMLRFRQSIPRDFLEATGTLNCDGWALFALDHTLEEGDVCVFELVGPGPAFLLFVHIFTDMESSGREHSIRGHSTSLNHKRRFETQAAAANSADAEFMLDRSKERLSLQKTIQKPRHNQAWTKLFKPRVRAHFGGSEG